VDLQTQLERRINRNLTVSLALARKNRSPSYIERFAWVPIEATGGLADGNNHVGNVDLDPETSRDVELSIEWTPENAYVTPRFFYRDVEGYIQGTPLDSTPNTIDSDEEMVSNVNGDPTPLKYRNVDARIYGAAATWGYDLPWWKNLRLDGTLSYLRGRRKDISDNLYRFAPSQAEVQVSYRPERWLFAMEGEFVDEQDDVSATNDEPTTPGYGLMNLRAQWYYDEATTVSLGLNNVFNKTYREHLAGFNRVLDSDVPTYDDRPSAESRIPGNERNLVLTLNYAW
jgi:iron complex outermembrane receptor protein